MLPPITPVDRRHFLKLLGMGSLALLAGCTREPSIATGSLQDPTAALVTRWRADQFARGSYSYLSRDNLPGDRKLLAAPVGRTLFFAGEATSSSNPATVHGALMSGWDAAAAIESIAGPDASIGVIGAGAAGIGAARQLVDGGHTVVVYEARDRIGGRVNTDTSLGVPIDLGASWIHGVNGNPLTAIADELEAPRVQTNWDSTVTYGADGSRMRVNFWSAASQAVNGAAGRGQTMQEAIDQALAGRDQQYIDRFNFAVVANFEQEYAADVELLSADAPHEGDYFSGGDVLLPDGYLALLEPMTDGLDIRLGSRVDCVTWGQNGAEIVAAGEEMAHDHVVVTLPLGVLKANDVTFDPPLPADKQGAVDRFGMGLLDKVALEFPEAFWNQAVDYFGYISPDRGKWAQWYDMERVTGRPILLAFHAGSAAEELEAMTDEAVVAEAMEVLGRLYG